MLGALASRTPAAPMGVGNIQPMVRYQWANVQAIGKAWNIDGALSYLVKGPALRVIATYSHVKLPRSDRSRAHRELDPARRASDLFLEVSVTVDGAPPISGGAGASAVDSVFPRPIRAPFATPTRESGGCIGEPLAERSRQKGR